MSIPPFFGAATVHNTQRMILTMMMMMMMKMIMIMINIMVKVKIAITRPIFKLGGPDFAWYKI